MDGSFSGGLPALKRFYLLLYLDSIEIFNIMKAVILYMDHRKDSWYAGRSFKGKELFLDGWHKIRYSMRLRPEKTCLCAIIDLGSVGCFNGEYAEPALEHLGRAGFEQAGTINATLLGRGVEDGKDIRLMELHIPLREKTL